MAQVMEQVGAAFVERFGTHAGWAHNTLFIVELASQQVLRDPLLPQSLSAVQVRLHECAPLCALRLGWLVERRSSMTSAKSFLNSQRAVAYHNIRSSACSCSVIQQVCRLIQCTIIAALYLVCSFARACSQVQIIGNCTRVTPASAAAGAPP